MAQRIEISSQREDEAAADNGLDAGGGYCALQIVCFGKRLGHMFLIGQDGYEYENFVPYVLLLGHVNEPTVIACEDCDAWLQEVYATTKSGGN